MPFLYILLSSNQEPIPLAYQETDKMKEPHLFLFQYSLCVNQLAISLITRNIFIEFSCLTGYVFLCYILTFQIWISYNFPILNCSFADTFVVITVIKNKFNVF